MAVVYCYIMEISIKVPADFSLSFPLQTCGTSALWGMASASSMGLVFFFPLLDGHLVPTFFTQIIIYGRGFVRLISAVLPSQDHPYSAVQCLNLLIAFFII